MEQVSRGGRFCGEWKDMSDVTFELSAPDVENPRPDDVREALAALDVLPDVPWLEPEDVSEALLWLCLDAARHGTGIAFPIDACNTAEKGRLGTL